MIGLQHAGSEQLYLTALDKFVEEKERDIEAICGDNYEVRSVRRIRGGDS